MNNPVRYHYGKFPPGSLDWERLMPYAEMAAMEVTRYDGALAAIPNAAVLLGPLTTREAVLSSRIEGTQATFGEVLEYEAGISSEREQDIGEVLNYRRALWAAVGMLDTLPLCQRVMLEAHRILLQGVRGQGKAPGEYRRIPNWIGALGCPIEEARYIPISAEKIVDAMSAWERYGNDEPRSRFVQLAVMHAEFEAIHPFLDGNGRLGRMCVPLFLYQMKIMRQPMFYISEFFDENREEYYERLLAVSRDDDWMGWCVFFLNAVRIQAEINGRKASAILDLYHRLKTEFAAVTRSQYAIHALEWVFKRPIFNNADFVHNAGIPEPTAHRILPILERRGILKTIVPGSGRRAKVVAFPDLLTITEGHAVV